MASFMDYYQEELRKRGVSSSPVAPQKPKRTAQEIFGKGNTAKDSGPQSFGSWLIDIVSRPLYAVTNTINKSVESAVSSQEKQEAGDGAGAFGDAIGTVLGVPGRFLEGLVSTDEDTKHTFGQTMEKVTDRIGLKNDPHYVDREDNVNPLAKGVVGFVGDVLLDPLTYIPPAWIAKVAKGSASLAKSAAKIPEHAAPRTAINPDDLEDLVPGGAAEVDVPKKTQADLEAGNPAYGNPLEGATHLEPGPASMAVPKGEIARMADDAAPTAATDDLTDFLREPTGWKDPDLDAPKPVEPVNEFKLPSYLVKRMPKQPKQAVDGVTLTSKATEAVVEGISTGKAMSQVIAESPRIPGIRKEIADLMDTLKAKPDATPTEVKPFPKTEEWSAKSAVRIPSARTDLNGLPANKVYAIYQGELAKANGGRVPVTLAEKQNARLALEPRGQAAREALLTAYNTVKASHEASATEAVVSGIEAYQRKLTTGDRVYRDIVGEELTDLLLSKKTPASANKLLAQIDNIFSGNVLDLDKILAKDARLADAILPRFKKELDAVKASPNTTQAVDSKLTDMELSPVSKVYSEVIREQNLPRTAAFEAKYGKQANGNPVAKADDDGTADWWRKQNTFTQASMLSKLDAHIKAEMVRETGKPVSALYGAERAAARRAVIERLGADVADTLETFGTPLHIGVGDGLVRMTFPQAYEIVGKVMDDLFQDVDITNLALHNGGTAVVPSRLLNVIHEVITNPNASVDDLASYIRKPTKDSAGANAKEVLPNNITATASEVNRAGKGSNAGRGYFFPGKSLARAKDLSNKTGGALNGGAKGRWMVYNKGGNLPEMLAQAIVAARPALIARAELNAAEWTARGISEASELAGKELRNLRALATNEAKAAERQMAQAVARRNAELAKNAANIAATPEGTKAAAVAVESALGDDVLREASIITTQERNLKEGMTTQEAGATATQKRVDADTDPTPEAAVILMAQPAARISASEAPAGASAKEVFETFDWGQKADAVIQNATAGTFGSRIAKAFNTHFDIHPVFRGISEATKTAAGRAVSDAVITPMKAIAAKYSRQEITQGIRAIQQGTKMAPDSAVAQAATEVEAVLGKMFDLDRTSTSIMGNVFTETGARIEHINEVLRWALGGNTSIQFSKPLAEASAKSHFAALGAKPSKADLDARTAFEMKEQWKAWDFGSDPAAALVSMGQAAARIAEHTATAASFMATAKKAGFAVVVPKGKRPPDGFVKLVDSRGDSAFGALLPKNTYVLKEIAPTLARMDYLARASRQLGGEAGEFVSSTLVPLTNTWKQGMTIYRPGHHVRNAVGTWTLQWVERGGAYMTQSSTATLKLLGKLNDTEGLDAIAALRSVGDDTIPTGGDVLVRGRYGDITSDELRAALNKEGLLPTYAASEGLLSEEVRQGGIVERLLRPLDAANNPVGRLGARVSQNLDHAQRTHHFMQIVMQEAAGKGKWGKISKEELYKRAAKEVRKLHPDSTSLTPFENKFMKLAIPFYTWVRGVLPGAIESALMHPGRVAVFPKASYNIAVAAGMNPDSLHDPFPEGELFPSFIKDSVLGPQFKIGDNAIRLNPGIAHVDLLNTFGGDPVRGIAGMTNPLFRVPAELMSGGSWATGGRIADNSDYIDQSLPGINYLSNLTGTSVTGSPESVLSGQGLDPQAQVAKGNKTDFDKFLSLANLLTGIGSQNLSKPNYKNYAEIEKRNRAGQENGK